MHFRPLASQLPVDVAGRERAQAGPSNIKVGDFAIAKPSSLAEEMLSIGKPVIICNDSGGWPGKVLDYGKLILANNYKEILM